MAGAHQGFESPGVLVSEAGWGCSKLPAKGLCNIAVVGEGVGLEGDRLVGGKGFAAREEAEEEPEIAEDSWGKLDSTLSIQVLWAVEAMIVLISQSRREMEGSRGWSRRSTSFSRMRGPAASGRFGMWSFMLPHGMWCLAAVVRMRRNVASTCELVAGGGVEAKASSVALA